MLSPYLSTDLPVDNLAGGIGHDSSSRLCLNRLEDICLAKTMANLLISYHSQSGSCARLASAALRGARRESGAAVNLLRTWDAGSRDLRQTDGLLLVVAENSGALSGGMKDFLDRIFYPAIAAELVIPYALVVSAGNDGRGAVRQAETILSGIPFSPATEALICRGSVTEQHMADCEELGMGFAAGLVMGIY